MEGWVAKKKRLDISDYMWRQAYTVELEAELNQLKEENARLTHTLAEAERKRRQELQEETKEKLPSKAQKSAEKLRLMRRTLSWPW